MALSPDRRTLFTVSAGTDIGIDGGLRGRDLAGASQAALDVARPPWLVRMEHVPRLRRYALASQFGEARAAPDVGRHVEVGREQVRARDHLPQDRAAAQQLHPRSALLRACPSRNRYIPFLMPSSAPSGIGGCG